jgi:hypothetical protein
LTELDPPNAGGNAVALRRPGAALQAHGLAVLQAVMLLVPAVWAIGHLYPPLNHDAALILDVSRRWLDGARLYVDVIDVNPPLIFALSTLPEIAVRLLGIGDGPTAFVAMTLALIAGALALSQRVLAQAPGLLGPIAGFLALPLLAFLLVVYPDDMFGQREHLMLAASVPYLMAAGARAAGFDLPHRLRAVVMLLAGIGFALKPYFLVAPALIEGYLLLARRSDPRDPALCLLGVGAALQAMLMFVLVPAYLDEVVPMALRQYAEQGDAMWQVATGGIIGPTIAAWAALAAITALMPTFRLHRVLALFVLGGIVAAVVQAKGWPYQSLPAVAACIFFAVMTAAALAELYLPPARRTRVAIGLAGVLLLIGCYNGAVLQRSFLPQRNWAGSDTKRLLDIVRRFAVDQRVLVISPGVQPIFPMVNYAGVQLVGRFESMWLLQGLYWHCARTRLYNPPWRMSADERRIFEGLTEDFVRERPSLVIIDRDAGIPECGGAAFDYLDYFGRNPEFAAALSGYEEIAGFGRYMVFRRSAEPELEASLPTP